MTPPVLDGAAGYAIGQLEPLARRDTEPDWPLHALTAAMTAGEETAWRLFVDPGLSVWLDPDVAPPSWLPLVALIVGARLAESMDVPARRRAIQTPEGWRRGQPATHEEVAKRFMAEPKRVKLRERTSPVLAGDQPGHVTLQVRASDVLPGQEAALETAFLRSLPVGLKGHVVFTDFTTYDDVSETYADYDAVDAANADYDDLLTP